VRGEDGHLLCPHFDFAAPERQAAASLEIVAGRVVGADPWMLVVVVVMVGRRRRVTLSQSPPRRLAASIRSSGASTAA
jgi:hypothetical protein